MSETNIIKRRDSSLNLVGIIPARWASSRYPGKPLLDLEGKSMLERVFIQASKVLNNVFIATDDARIVEACAKFGARAILTDDSLSSGTDRCYQALQIIMVNPIYGDFSNIDVVINIQGDEPFLNPTQIEELVSPFLSDSSTEIATLIKRVEEFETLDDFSVPKVVIDCNSNALYFSRFPIPYPRGFSRDVSLIEKYNYYKHIGLYAYTPKVLKEITSLKVSSLESIESLEQLRWLEAGYKIKTSFTTFETIAIDTPEDYNRALSHLKTLEKE